jgi:uncharacterized membrane protein (UPF0127 family)
MIEMKLSVNDQTTDLRVTLAHSFFQRLAGLMGKASPPAGGLLLSPCSSIHTFFMRFAIDAVFLDSENKVIKLVSDLHPWRIAVVPKAHRTLELPTGKARELSLKRGDVLLFS